MNKGIQFKEIRNYASVTDRVSICRKETGNYKNFSSIRDVPDTYNELYLYGFGVIDSEDFSEPQYSYVKHMEIMLTGSPRQDI